MHGGLQEHWRRTQETMRRFLGPELAEQTPPIGADDGAAIEAFVQAQAADFSDDEIYLLPHDHPLDTALEMLGSDARAWRRENADRFAAYKRHAQAEGWSDLPPPAPEPVDIAAMGRAMRTPTAVISKIDKIERKIG